MRATLQAHGFEIVPNVLDADQLRQLQEAVADIDAVGVRSLCAKVPAVHSLASGPTLRALVESVLGANSRLVRSIFFNKSGERNWQVAWHQDVTIAVAASLEVAGFGAWSLKEGVPHVQAPTTVLERMLTVRVHLDAADAENGALWVAPGSHLRGQIRDEVQVVRECGVQLCPLAAGAALLMRPLLLHSSRKSTSNRPRRVIHLEFAEADVLPEPLQWAEAG